jgi:hypothetical protein
MRIYLVWPKRRSRLTNFTLCSGLIGTGRSMGMDQLHRMQQRVEMVRARRGAPPPPHHRRRQHWRSWNSAKNPKHNGALGTKMAECSAPSERTSERGSCLNGAGERHFLLHTRPGAPLSDCCILHCCYGALMRFCISICSVLMAPFPREMILRPNSAAKSKYHIPMDIFIFIPGGWKVVNRTQNALFKRKFADIARLYFRGVVEQKAHLGWSLQRKLQLFFSARADGERGKCDRRSNLD